MLLDVCCSSEVANRCEAQRKKPDVSCKRALIHFVRHLLHGIDRARRASLRASVAHCEGYCFAIQGMEAKWSIERC
jgi:hypothetical protein